MARKRVPRWMIERNKLRTQTAAEDRKALSEILREQRLARRRERE